MIQVENLVKHYGEVKAVESINFQVNDGEILGFLGANGAGKSTTLKIMTGYLSPTSGNVIINDKNILEHSLEIRRMIGYLPEMNPLYPEMRVYDLLEFTARIRGIEGKAFRQALERVIEQCGVTDVLHRLVQECSKGYKQRVGLACAIIHDPSILILDEPVTGLDPNQIVEIRNLIKELGREKMVVISSHILQEIEATVDRLVIIHKGEIIADGTSEELIGNLQGNTQMTLGLKGADEDGIHAMQKAIPDIDVKHIETNADRMTLNLEFTQDQDPREQIFHHAVDANWVIVEMSTRRAHLEDLFRQLTVEGGATHE